MSDTSATPTTQVPPEWDTNNTSETRAAQMLHEWYTNDMRATQVKNFDNNRSENIFSHPYISFIANEILQGEE